MAGVEPLEGGGTAGQVVQAWQNLLLAARQDVERISAYGKQPGTERVPLQRLNGGVQDKLAGLRAQLRDLELLAEEQDSEQESEALQQQLQHFKEEYNALRLSLRSANVHAKLNAENAARQERELLLGGGQEATLRRRKLQTQAEMTAAAEDVTDSLRRTRQLMTQEVERGIETLQVMGESNRTLRKSDKEYGGQRSLLGTTRRLLSALQRQDVQDRMIVVVGSLLFVIVCTYVFWKRMPLINRILPLPWVTRTAPPVEPPGDVSSDLFPPSGAIQPPLQPGQKLPEPPKFEEIEPAGPSMLQRLVSILKAWREREVGGGAEDASDSPSPSQSPTAPAAEEEPESDPVSVLENKAAAVGNSTLHLSTALSSSDPNPSFAKLVNSSDAEINISAAAHGNQTGAGLRSTSVDGLAMESARAVLGGLNTSMAELDPPPAEEITPSSPPAEETSLGRSDLPLAAPETASSAKNVGAASEEIEIVSGSPEAATLSPPAADLSGSSESAGGEAMETGSMPILESAEMFLAEGLSTRSGASNSASSEASSVEPSSDELLLGEPSPQEPFAMEPPFEVIAVASEGAAQRDDELAQTPSPESLMKVDVITVQPMGDLDERPLHEEPVAGHARSGEASLGIVSSLQRGSEGDGTVADELEPAGHLEGSAEEAPSLGEESGVEEETAGEKAGGVSTWQQDKGGSTEPQGGCNNVGSSAAFINGVAPMECQQASAGGRWKEREGSLEATGSSTEEVSEAAMEGSNVLEEEASSQGEEPGLSFGNLDMGAGGPGFDGSATSESRKGPSDGEQVHVPDSVEPDRESSLYGEVVSDPVSNERDQEVEEGGLGLAEGTDLDGTPHTSSHIIQTDTVPPVRENDRPFEGDSLESVPEDAVQDAELEDPLDGLELDSLTGSAESDVAIADLEPLTSPGDGAVQQAQPQVDSRGKLAREAGSVAGVEESPLGENGPNANLPTIALNSAEVGAVEASAPSEQTASFAELPRLSQEPSRSIDGRPPIPSKEKDASECGVGCGPSEEEKLSTTQEGVQEAGYGGSSDEHVESEADGKAKVVDLLEQRVIPPRVKEVGSATPVEDDGERVESHFDSQRTHDEL